MVLNWNDEVDAKDPLNVKRPSPSSMVSVKAFDGARVRVITDVLLLDVLRPLKT